MATLTIFVHPLTPPPIFRLALIQWPPLFIFSTWHKGQVLLFSFFHLSEKNYRKSQSQKTKTNKQCNDPLFEKSQTIFDNFSLNEPFWQHFVKHCHLFCRNCCQRCVQSYILLGKLTKICLSVWYHFFFFFFVFSLNFLLFRRKKSLIDRPPIFSSCCPSIPVSSKVECPGEGCWCSFQNKVKITPTRLCNT